MAYSSGTVTVAATPTLIASAGIGGALLLANTGAVTVFLGGSTVAASSYPLAASTSLEIPISGTEDENLYGIVATGTATVVYLSAGTTA